MMSFVREKGEKEKHAGREVLGLLRRDEGWVRLRLLLVVSVRSCLTKGNQVGDGEPSWM